MNSIAWQTTVSMGIMMALGYFIRKRGLVDNNFTHQLSTMMYYSIIPCIIISSTANMAFSREQLHNGLTMLLIGCITIAVMYVLGTALYWLSGRQARGRLMRFSMYYTNFTIMGLSLAQSVYGDEGLFCFSMMLIPVRIYSYISADRMLSGVKTEGTMRQRLKGVFSPLLIYTLVGLAIFLFQIPLPQVISSTVTTISKAMTPCGMILCGLLLGQADIRKKMHSKSLYGFLAAKLVAAPLLILGVLYLLGYRGLIVELCVLFCSLPVAAAMGPFAVKNECAPEDAAVYIAASTVLSVVSVPAVISLAAMVVS